MIHRSDRNDTQKWSGHHDDVVRPERQPQLDFCCKKLVSATHLFRSVKPSLLSLLSPHIYIYIYLSLSLSLNWISCSRSAWKKTISSPFLPSLWYIRFDAIKTCLVYILRDSNFLLFRRFLSLLIDSVSKQESVTSCIHWVHWWYDDHDSLPDQDSSSFNFRIFLSTFVSLTPPLSKWKKASLLCLQASLNNVHDEWKLMWIFG